MARPTLIKKGNTWYRDGKPVKYGYKYFDTAEKLWKILKEDGNFYPYQVGVRTRGTKPTQEELAIQYAKFDLAPSVPFLDDHHDYTAGNDFYPFGEEYDYSGTEKARKQNAKVNHDHYYQVQDSIGSRIYNGFYEKYPEQYQRDIKLRNLYKLHPTCPGGWTCINSVEGLRGRTQWSNRDFVENNRYSQRGFTRISLNDPKAQEIYDNMQPGTLLLTPNYGHMIMYLGNNLWYDNHGTPAPYKNGNQITNKSYNRYINNNYDVPGFLFIKSQKQGGKLIPKPFKLTK